MNYCISLNYGTSDPPPYPLIRFDKLQPYFASFSQTRLLSAFQPRTRAGGMYVNLAAGYSSSLKFPACFFVSHTYYSDRKLTPRAHGMRPTPVTTSLGRYDDVYLMVASGAYMYSYIHCSCFISSWDGTDVAIRTTPFTISCFQNAPKCPCLYALTRALYNESFRL